MAIAITGNIGSGKTTVLKYLTKKGYDTFICDDYNASLLNKGSDAYPLIYKEFKECFIDDKLNKKALAQIIFNDENKKKILENILHPLIIKEMFKRMKKNDDLMAEVPLLFEKQLDKFFKHNLLIVTDEEILISRLLKRGLNDKEINERLNNQMNINDKIKKADYIIYNNGSLEELYLEIEKWIKLYVRK